jgi:Flp pilus assembly protein TadD
MLRDLLQHETVALLQNAARLHSQGQLAQAAAIYREIVARYPENPDALHLLGVALTQSGEHANGIEYIRRSLHVNPAQPVAYANLGNAEHAVGSIGAAEATRCSRSTTFKGRLPASTGPWRSCPVSRRPWPIAESSCSS